MAPIKLKDLEFAKMKRWVKEAKCRLKKDPIVAFISAWISFNYYYSTFTCTNRDKFRTWYEEYFKQRLKGPPGHKAKLTFLIKHKDFKQFFSDFKKRNGPIFDKSVDLPVRDMLTDKLIPENRNGAFKLENLGEEEIFKVIYQIRNNLFHGDKDPIKNRRDKELSEIAGEFMVQFLIELIDYTNGEVKDTGRRYGT